MPATPNLASLLQDFPWESDEQRKGVLAFVQWAERLYARTDKEILMLPSLNQSLFVLMAFLAQKDHEGGRWVTEVMGEHLTSLRDQIRLVQNEVHSIREAVIGRLDRTDGAHLPS